MIERHLTFRLLRVYVTLIQTTSISETARQLHLTQPTVSIQLKKLQETVGQPLFYFQNQRFVLTEAGSELYKTAQKIFGSLEDFNDQLTDITEGLKGHMSIAMVNTAQYILPQLIGPFQQAFPEIEVTLEIGNREQVLKRFEQSEDDLYVFSHPPSLEHAIAEPLLPNSLALVAKDDHPLAQQERISIDQLVHERFLLREPGSATRMMFDSFIQNQEVTLHHCQQLASNEAIRMGISSGMGIGMLSEHVLSGQKGLVALNVNGLPLNNHWYFIARNDRYMPKAALSFLTYCQNSADLNFEKKWSIELEGKIVNYFS